MRCSQGEQRIDRGAWIGSGIATFTASGYAAHAEVCRTLIALAFRRMLARANLREQPDAKPDRRAAGQTRAPRIRSHRHPMIGTRTGGSDRCSAWNGASPSDPAN